MLYDPVQKFQYCQPAQKQPKSRILFHKNGLPRDFYIIDFDHGIGFNINIVLILLQDIPTYCITLTLLVLCLDRHQSIRHPEPGPLPMRWILALVWVISVALVLPYMAYITHVDLSVSAIRWCPICHTN